MTTMATARGGDLSNSATSTIDASRPYAVELQIRGSADLLFHRWQSDAVEAKAAAAKGSRAKKTDDVDSYVWRNAADVICLPGEYIRGAVAGPAGAAKYRQDPRSPRKSALDLCKSGIVSLTDLAPITKVTGEVATTWDYLDRRRVTVQRNGITRERPALLAGWSCTVVVQVLLPEYIEAGFLHDILIDAGRLVGVGDFRPTFGRFTIDRFDILS
jgi:hypothetical protein